MSAHAADFMTPSVLSVTPDTRLEELERFFVAEGVSGAPVVRDGRVVGVVSRADVVRVLAGAEHAARLLVSFYQTPWDEEVSSVEVLRQTSETLARRLARLRVRDAMSDRVLAVEADTPLQEVARCMAEERVHRLLVLDDGTLRGLVSSLDVARAVAERGLAG